MDLVTLHTLWTYYTHTLFLLFSLILWIHRKSGQQQHYRFTVSMRHFSFIHFFALESGRHTHTDSIGYIIYTHTDAHATRLPYHTIDLPFIFSLSVHPFPPITREWTAKTDVDTAKRDIDPVKTDGKTA